MTVPVNNDHYDYEAVNDDELVQDDDEDEDDDEEDNDIDQPEYLRNSPPLSAIDVDIRIVRQKMSFAEASLELIRVSISSVYFNVVKLNVPCQI